MVKCLKIYSSSNILVTQLPYWNELSGAVAAHPHAVLPPQLMKGCILSPCVPLMLSVAPGSPAASLHRGQQADKSMQRPAAPGCPGPLVEPRPWCSSTTTTTLSGPPHCLIHVVVVVIEQKPNVFVGLNVTKINDQQYFTYVNIVICSIFPKRKLPLQ